MGRRAPGFAHPKLTSHVADFAALPALPPVDDVYIALGTTIKAAGSQQAFRAVDFEAVMAVALAARASGATKSGVVSAMGANARSRVFYNRVKGEMEDALSRLGFETLVIARPSLLAGDRDALHQPGRSGEKLALVAAQLFKRLIPGNYRAIRADQVASALVKAVMTGPAGQRVLLSGELQRL